MRYIFTFLTAFFLSLSAFAENEGKMTITLPSDQFTVLVNGRIYQVIDNKVTIENIGAGEYRVKIYKYGGTTGNASQSPGPLYSVFIAVKPGFHVNMTVDVSGKLSMVEKSIVDISPTAKNNKKTIV